MICFDMGSHRFQMRAAAVIIEEEQVLLHRVVDETIWALPGGRIEAGESAAKTIAREMLEETGESVACGEMLFVVENFFHHDDQAQHEIGLYMQAQLPSSSALSEKTCSHEGIEGSKRLEFRWFAVDTLQQVDVRPEFLRTALATSPSTLSHIVQNG